MIQIDAQNETALNTETGGKCRVVQCNGQWYTNTAGLIKLETGNYQPKALRNLLSQWQTRQTEEYLNLLKPIDFNDGWLYSVRGWEIIRERAKERKKS